jgi:hypothetical protein
VIEGWSYALNSGLVGIGSDNARGTFDRVTVQKLPPEITLDETVDFEDGTAGLLAGESLGNWLVGGDARYLGLPALGDELAFSAADLGGLAHSSYLELSAVLNTDATGGLVFDQYADDDFKFVAIDVESGQLVIGHHSPKHGRVIDVAVDRPLVAGQDYLLKLIVKGTGVSVSLDGQTLSGFGFNGAVVDGGFGVFSWGGASAFDEFTVKTNDPQFATEADPESLVAATAATFEGAQAPVSEEQLRPILDAAARRWLEAGMLSADDLERIDDVRLEITDLSDRTLGQASADTIWIDATAAGHGWFIDTTPIDDSEFRARAADGVLRATPDSDAFGGMDLLSVVMHELGHVFGLDSHELLGDTLGTGLRVEPARSPAPDAAAASDSSVPLSYEIRVLAAEALRQQDEDEDDDDLDFTIQEISLDSGPDLLN